VLDATAPAAYGGTGRRVDWTKAVALAAKLPVMLAGGLTPRNVAEAIRQVRPLGVDVASGVERAPGKKDRRKLEEFIAAARSAAGDRS
jgi:phosphoribosylanthranilate isomerase